MIKGLQEIKKRMIIETMPEGITIEQKIIKEKGAYTNMNTPTAEIITPTLKKEESTMGEYIPGVKPKDEITEKLTEQLETTNNKPKEKNKISGKKIILLTIIIVGIITIYIINKGGITYLKTLI